MAASWRLCTSAFASGAIAVIEIRASDCAALDDTMKLLTGRTVAIGGAPLRGFAGIDHGVGARPNETTCFIMFHGGPQVVRSMCDALTELGVIRAEVDHEFPEARNHIEERVLRALCIAQSPDAVDALLAQPALWRGESMRGEPTEQDLVLNRLIHPPTVAAIGGANIGKSSMLNALAGRTVAVAADEPGTTTDHIGVRLILDGLCVHFVDTPGIRADAPEHERRAADTASRVVSRASLVLLCGDRTTPAPNAPQLFEGRVLRVNLRSDLGAMHGGSDVAVSVRDSSSIDQLSKRIREELVPRRLLEPIGRWRFDDGAPERTADTGRS